MTPSWYDLLDVDRDAGSDEIRAAWRARVADLDPTDRRFAVLNEAAAVLLDRDRRAAHDAELAEQESAQPAAPPEPVIEPPASAGPAEARSADHGATSRTAEHPPSRVPLWLPVLLAVLVLAVAGAATWFATKVPAHDDGLAATRSAQATAERAIVPVLSYDYRTLDADRAAAVSYLTDDFRDEDYEPLFTQLEENAPSTKAVVEAAVRASAITRGGDERVQVLLFVDQVTTNAETTEPVTYRNQVTVTMARVGDRWLVDDLQTTRG